MTHRPYLAHLAALCLAAACAAAPGSVPRAGGAAFAQTPSPPPAGQTPADDGARDDTPQDREPRQLLDLDRLAAEQAAASSALGAELRARELQGLPAARAAMLVSGKQGGQVALAPLAMPVLLSPGSDGETRAAVALVVEIDGPSLLGPSPSGTPQVEIYAYALTADGAVAGFLSQTFALDLTAIGEAVFVGGVKFAGHLELPPGDYVVRLLVHDASSERFGLRSVAISVPRTAALFTPFAAEPPDAPWVRVAEAPHGEMGALDLGRVLSRAGLPMPAPLPLLRGDAARLDLLLYGAAGSELPPTLRALVLDADDRPAGEVEATILERQPTRLPALERLAVRLPLTDLATGSYFIELEADSLGGQAATSPKMPALVLRGESVANLWTDIQRRLSSDQATASLDLEEVRKRRRGRQKRMRQAIASAYRKVITRLGDGDRRGALADLQGIEQQVLDSGQENSLELLEEAETSIVNALSVSDPQALFPLVLLHGDAYDSYRQSLDFALSTHSREMAVKTAEVFANHTRDEAAKRLASAALSSFGAYLQTAQVRVTGRALLRRAIELDPDNRFAMLQLATGLEKTGEYEAAVDVLRRLVALDPKAPEGRVRLAVNLRRLGRSGEAATLLRRVVGEVNPDWVLTVAYEELASMMLSGGNADGAASLLEQAVGRLPDQGRLRLQLAYALDRTGRSARARQVIAGLGPAAGDEPSPRNRYTRWPETGEAELRSRIEEAARLRALALSTATAGLPPAEELEEWTQEKQPEQQEGGSER